MQGQNNADVNQQEYNVPINESLKGIIPFDQKIVFSTRISVSYEIANSKGYGAKTKALGYLLAGTIAGAMLLSKTLPDFQDFYYTDALVAEEGLALNLPSFYWANNGKMKRKRRNPQYTSWRNIHFPSTDGLQGSFEIDPIYKCHLIHKKNYGSREQFNVHKEQFFKLVPKIRDACVIQYMKTTQSAADLDNTRLEDVGLLVLDFLQGHPGKAFTNESLMKRLRSEIDNQEWLDYLDVIHLKRFLRKFLLAGEIGFNEHKGRLYYFSLNC